MGTADPKASVTRQPLDDPKSPGRSNTKNTPRSPFNFEQVVDSLGTYGRSPSDQSTTHERKGSEPFASQLRPYLILSLDAGGLRGVFVIRLLRRLDAAYPGFLENVNLVAGASSGGVIALGIAAGIDLVHLENLYLNSNDELFNTSIAGALENMTGRFAACPYSSEGRLNLFVREFSRTPAVYLRDLKRKVFIPTVRLKALPPNPNIPSEDVTAQTGQQWNAQFFHNFMHSADNDGHVSIVDVAMRTTAAPTYYPIYQGYADGGVVACNPSVPALAQALDKKRGAGVRLNQVRLLSIGTGQARTAIEEANAPELPWGKLKWLEHGLLIDILMDGVSSVNHYIAQQLLGEEGYRRIDFVLPFKLDTDAHDPELLRQLVDLADDVAAHIVEADRVRGEGVGVWIRHHFVQAVPHIQKPPTDLPNPPFLPDESYQPVSSGTAPHPSSSPDESAARANSFSSVTN